MAAVERRELDRVIVYMSARLWRNRGERADGIERLAKARVSVTATKGPDLDLSSATGRMLRRRRATSRVRAVPPGSAGRGCLRLGDRGWWIYTHQEALAPSVRVSWPARRF
jgi:hypothetical protein